MKFDGIAKLKKTSAVVSSPKGWRIVYICMDDTSQYYKGLFYKFTNSLHRTYVDSCIWYNKDEQQQIAEWESEVA